MKDLYRKLNVAPASSAAEIRSALNRCLFSPSTTDRADTEHVLLDDLRRQKYDSVHKTVQTITDLRHELSIVESSGKLYSPVHGFMPVARSQANTRSDIPPASPSKSKALRLIVGMAAVGIVIFLLFAIDTKKRWPRNQKPVLPSSILATASDSSYAPRQSTTYYPPTQIQPAGYQRPRKVVETISETGQLALPPTGLINRYDSARELAPLAIQTRRGSGSYYVKISRLDKGVPVLSRTAFIRDGDTLNILMPIGNFEIRYANGRDWFGTQRLFGRETSRSRADETFRFEQSQGGYSGYAIELYLQANGNLETEYLSEDEF